MIPAERTDEVRRRAERDHLAVVDDRDAITEPLGFVHVMRGHQDGDSGGRGHRPLRSTLGKLCFPDRHERRRPHCRGDGADAAGALGFLLGALDDHAVVEGAKFHEG